MSRTHVPDAESEGKVCELKVDATWADGSDHMVGTVVISIDDGRRIDLSFAGRNVYEGGEDFLIRICRMPGSIPLLEYSGPQSEADWHSAPLANIGLLALLSRPLGEAEHTLKTALSDSVVEKIADAFGAKGNRANVDRVYSSGSSVQPNAVMQKWIDDILGLPN